MSKSWNKEDIVALLDRNNLAVERAIVYIYSKQTESEKSAAFTTETNNVGFNKFDAKTGTYLAKWILSGRHLSGEFLEKGRKLSKKYVRQLVEKANSN